MSQKIQQTNETQRKINQDRFAPDGISPNEHDAAADYIWNDIKVKVPDFTCKFDSYERIASPGRLDTASSPNLISELVLRQYPRMNNIFAKYSFVERPPQSVNNNKILLCTSDQRVYTEYGILIQSERNTRYEDVAAYTASDSIEMRDEYFDYGRRFKQKIAERKDLEMRFARAEAQERIAKKCLGERL